MASLVCIWLRLLAQGLCNYTTLRAAEVHQWYISGRGPLTVADKARMVQYRGTQAE